MAKPAYRADRPIALVGLMGAGKSSLGRRLAVRLGLPFIDTDCEIERQSGLSVGEIFEQYGEARFRDWERRTISDHVNRRPAVIATGGGGFIDPDIRRLMLDRCVVIWIDADPGLLAERVKRGDHRPLARGPEAGVRLAVLAERRNPAYAMAHISVRSEAIPHDEMVDRILHAVSEWAPETSP